MNMRKDPEVKCPDCQCFFLKSYLDMDEDGVCRSCGVKRYKAQSNTCCVGCNDKGNCAFADCLCHSMKPKVDGKRVFNEMLDNREKMNNGLILTNMSPKDTQEMNKRFDEKFDHIIPKILMEGKDALMEVKSFIQSETTIAYELGKKEMLEEVLKEIDNLNYGTACDCYLCYEHNNVLDILKDKLLSNK